MSLVQELNWVMKATMPQKLLSTPMNERVNSLVNMMKPGKKYKNKDFVEMCAGKFSRVQINNILSLALENKLIKEIKPIRESYITKAKVYQLK